jgi:hypothetical protein
MDSDEPGRGRRFGNKLGEVPLECLFETEDLFPYALLLLFLGFGIYLVAGMTYHLIFDPSALNVATKLELLSGQFGQEKLEELPMIPGSGEKWNERLLLPTFSSRCSFRVPWRPRRRIAGHCEETSIQDQRKVLPAR